MRKPEAGEFLGPAEDLLHDSIFWQHQRDGLAVFLSRDFSLVYRLPSPLKEMVVLGNTLHIKPLLPLLSGDGKFYLLTISRNEIRLFIGTRETISEVPLKDVPRDIEMALWMDEQERYENPCSPSIFPLCRFLSVAPD